MSAQDWMNDSVCRSLSPETVDRIFFNPSKKRGSSKEAKAFCHTCPVKRKCLNYAILYQLKGIWGGTTESEREDLKWIRAELEARANLAGQLVVFHLPGPNVRLESYSDPIESLAI